MRFRHRLSRFALITLLILGLLSILSPASLWAQSAPRSVASPTQPELRGVWLTNIDSDVLFSKLRLKQGLERLQRMRFNTIYPTVLNNGYTLYPSKVAQAVVGASLDPEPGLQGRDMLAEAVTEGHRLGLAVIPWLEFGFMLPEVTPLAQSHPDWIARRADGSDIWLEGQRIPRRWLSPFHPQVQQFLIALVAEILTHYDVDGIQFDDHLGLPVDFGYDAYTTRLYQREHKGQRPPQDPNDPEWIRWRADKISVFVTQLFHTVKALKPNAIVSLAPNPHEFAYTTYLQDWQRWEREGYIEELIVQVYRSDLPRFLAELNHPTVQKAQGHIPTGIGILVGLKGREIPIKQIETQVESVRKAKLGGVAFFFYETLGRRDRDFQALFPTVAARP